MKPSNIVNYFIYVIKIIAHAIIFVPFRNKQIWVFGSEDLDFAGNSKYLYLYCHNQTKIKPIWITHNSQLVTELRDRGYDAFSPYSIYGIYYSLRADVCIITRSIISSDIPWEFINGSKLIQLWHGVPIKKISIISKENGVKEKIKKYIDDWKIFIITSDEIAKDLFLSANIPENMLETTGYPREKPLYSSVDDSDIKSSEKAKEILYKNPEATVITYLPTWRKWQHPIKTLDLKQIDQVLVDTNSYLLTKPHNKHVSPSQEKLNNIEYLSPHVDIYPTLAKSDVLITDYSSVSFDYLLADGKIIYYVPDIDKYKSRVGFQTTFESVTPGPKVKTTNQLCYWIAYFSGGGDRYMRERKELKQKVYSFDDGESDRRVVEAIQNIQ